MVKMVKMVVCTGLGGNDVLGGGMYGSPRPQGAHTTGGVGTAQTKSISVTNPETLYTENGSWQYQNQ